MSLLQGGLQTVFGAAFGAHFLNGRLYRIKDATTFDGRGRKSRAAVETERVKVQVETVTERMRQADGFTDEDVRLIVLQRGPDGYVAKPSSDDEIEVRNRAGGWDLYAVDMVAADPANTYWEMRATPGKPEE